MPSKSQAVLPASADGGKATEEDEGAVATDDAKNFVKSKRVAASVRHDNEAIIPYRPPFDQQYPMPVDRSDRAPVSHGVAIMDLIPVSAIPQADRITEAPKVVKRRAAKARVPRQDVGESITGQANTPAGWIARVIISRKEVDDDKCPRTKV